MPDRRSTNTELQKFYDDQLAGCEYASALEPSQHPYSSIVERFVKDYRLSGKRCLEVGCGRGAFQDLVDDYTGIDVSESVPRQLHKPFVRADATSLPFEDNSFDAVWTITVLEHVPQPESALKEICRVTRHGGLVLLAPAWHTRPWFADGYLVRSFGELSWRGRLIKASIPFRDFFLYRHAKVMLSRGVRLLLHLRQPCETPLRFVRLRPNYHRYWMSDSDACSSFDPFDFIVWFESRGHRCLSHARRTQQLLVRDLSLVFQVNKRGGK